MMKLIAILFLFVTVTFASEKLNKEDDNRGVITCSLCRETFDLAIEWYETGVPIPEMVNRLTTVCTDLGIYTERVCRGAVEINIDYFLWIIVAKNETATPLTSSEICGFALYGECEFDTTNFEWTLDLSFLGPKPTPEIPQVPPQGSPTLKVIQFTDVHIDPNYMPGYNAECEDEPICCRFDQGIPENASAAAGYWGDYRHCDAPIHHFQNLVAEAANRHQDVAYVIFTGDIVDHAVWATGVNYNENLMDIVFSELSVNFPSSKVIPIFGNHESHPCNIFSDPSKTEIPANLSTTWLYNYAATTWNAWLPPETVPDILNGGSFAYEVTPGLWLLYDNVDPAGELVWLANKLLAIEQEGKKAHILGHHPSGSGDCTHFWSIQYRRIIDRFENTLLAQFHGHTHNDQFHVYYAENDSSRPINVAFTAGSGTAFSDINPNYRVYTVDASTFRILDHETWYYNLTEANLQGSAALPNWQKLYSFNEAYNTTAVFPVQMDNIVHRLVNDTDLQYQYFRFYVKDGDAELAEGCDVSCMENLVCKTVITVANDNSKCEELYPPILPTLIPKNVSIN